MATFTGTGNNDTLTGAAESDLLDGLGGDDLLQGNGGRDTLRGGAGIDTLEGGAGADLLDGGSGIDVLRGGAGDDTYVVGSTQELPLERAGEGHDLVQAAISYTLGAQLERLQLLGTAARGTGNALANDLLGNAADNLLRGLGGTDRIGGASGDDTLDGGSSRDYLDGGPGNDVYLVENPFDVVNESRVARDGGVDRVVARVDWTLGPYVEELALAGTADLRGTGNAGDNLIVGNPGNNTLNGSFGLDTLAGGRGDDTYILDNYGDTVLEFGESDTGGIDTVYANFSYALGNAEEHLFLGGTGDLGGEGNALDNAINGQAGDNALRGLGGDDTLIGGAGDDSIAGGPGRDSVVGGAGADLFFLDGRGGSNADLVDDFGRGGDADRIAVEADAVGLPAGALDPSRFVAGAGFTAARDAEQRLVYDTSTGRLYLDADGQGGTAPVVLAQFGVDTHPLLSAADIVVVDLPRLGGVGARIETVEAAESFTLPSRLRDADLRLLGSAVEGGGNDFENGILGNEGGNLLRGYAGRDTLAGGPGDDTLDGGAGNDRLFGGQGADLFALSYPGDADFIADFTTAEDRFSLNLRVFRGIDGAEGGMLAADLFHSAAGAREAPDPEVRIVYDSATGALWYDADGASGRPDDVPPLQIAQLGDRVAPALSASDFTLTTEPLASHDTARLAVSVALGADDRFRNVRLEGDQDLDATGNAEDNELGGNAGANVLSGASGNDTLIGYEGDDTFDGGEGDDTYYVDDPGDVVEEADAAGVTGLSARRADGAERDPTGTGGGIDTVISQVNHTLRSNIENLTLSGNDDLQGKGNSLANLLVGNGGNNLLDALGGADILDGGAGNDTLQGGDGEDTLGGGDGNDTLAGGAGADALSGGKGTDRFTFDAPLGSGNVDTVSDFTVGKEKIQLDDDVFTAFKASESTAVSAAQFLAAAGASAAQTATQRIVYDTTSGKLYYDADGAGGAAAQHVATFGSGSSVPVLGANDFLIVG